MRQFKLIRAQLRNLHIVAHFVVLEGNAAARERISGGGRRKGTSHIRPRHVPEVDVDIEVVSAEIDVLFFGNKKFQNFGLSFLNK